MKTHILAVDLGNTRGKAALFTTDNVCIAQTRWEHDSGPSAIMDFLRKQAAYPIAHGAYISTTHISNDLSPVVAPFLSQVNATWAEVTATQESFPLTLNYQTPETLGADRLMSAIAASSYFPGAPVMVVDMGTAITYDVVDATGTYVGGGIAPGIRMRFAALHQLTARLPLVSPTDTLPLWGDTTETSLQVGAQGGAFHEILGIIHTYRNHLGADLHIFVTGGDSHLFEKHMKNPNFAHLHPLPIHTARYDLVMEGIFLTIAHRHKIL